MIKEVEIIISFPLGAYFTTNPQLLLYKGFLVFIKSLFCINSEKKCHQCQKRNECRYYSCTGECFSQYSGMLTECSLFNKRRYEKNEETKFRFYFIGKCAAQITALKLYVQDELKQNLFGAFFYIKDIRVVELENVYQNGTYLQTLTPMSNEDFFTTYAEQIDYYNQHYETNIEKATICVGRLNFNKTAFPEIRLDGVKLLSSGYEGNASGLFSLMYKPIEKIGVGKNNAVLLGKYEIKN